MKRNKTHLIIGSNSFLGHALSKKLVERGESVFGVYHKNTNNLYDGVSHIPISKLANLESCFDTVYIVSAFVPNESSEDVERKLFEANEQLVATICNQFRTSKIIYCSSVSIYNIVDKKITENSTPKPTTLYGTSKLSGEDIVRKMEKFAIVRISSMYGIGMKCLTFLPLVIKSALEINRITLFGDGKRQQNYIHVTDVADYLIAASNYNENGTFLAVSENSISNIEVANSIKNQVKDINIIFQGEDNSKSYFYDNTHTNKLLKIKTKKEFKTEVKSVIEWMKKEL